MGDADDKVPFAEVAAFFASLPSFDEPVATRRHKTPEEIEEERQRADETTLFYEAEEWTKRVTPSRPGDSPIETLLIQAIGLFANPISRGGCADIPSADGTPLYELDGWHGFWQLKVGTYFADIAFVRASGRPGVVVECDGHDFHERTKKQAAHDRRRDRSMTSNGWTVLRYTGSEIHADPVACACDALDHLARIGQVEFNDIEALYERSRDRGTANTQPDRAAL